MSSGSNRQRQAASATAAQPAHPEASHAKSSSVAQPASSKAPASSAAQRASPSPSNATYNIQLLRICFIHWFEAGASSSADTWSSVSLISSSDSQASEGTATPPPRASSPATAASAKPAPFVKPPPPVVKPPPPVKPPHRVQHGCCTRPLYITFPNGRRLVEQLVGSAAQPALCCLTYCRTASSSREVVLQILPYTV